jgi:hypothetical protein
MLPLDESNAIGQSDDQFLLNIIATILDIIATSWANVVSRKEVHPSDWEITLAGCLGREMIAIKNQRFGKNAQFRIEEEIGTRSFNNPAKPEGRIDIKIIYSFIESEYFGIECKRIYDQDDKLARKYVTEGLMRFITGKYSPGHDWMAMIGFVVDGHMAQSIERICGFLAITKKETCLISGWQQETRFGRHQYLYSTSHKQRGKETPITVLHFFLSLASHADATA